MERNDFYRYEILSEFESAPRTSNRIVTAKLGCSVKLAHGLVTELVGKGFVHVKKRNSRSWDYLLTPKGLKEKARLAGEFLEFTFKFYHEARKRSSQVCRELAEEGCKSVALLGTGQLAEIAYLGVKEWGMELTEAYSDEPGATLLGLKAKPFSQFKSSKADAALVCLHDKAKPMKPGYLPEGLAKTEKTRWIF